MWSIRAHHKNSHEIISIDADDIVFVAVLKRGPIVHTSKDSLVRCYHIAEYDNNVNLSFDMSILDSSCITQEYPEFATIGLMGRWKLLAPKMLSKFPTIVLLENYENVYDFRNDVISDINPSWIKNSYLNIL
jgi:hypothetical protein